MQPHRGKFLLAKNDKQRLYVQLIREKRIVFAIGEPGTGKSFIPCSLAIQDLNAGKIDKIILLRPVVEAGESLGFLPGDLNEKIQPYILPLLYQFIDAGLEQKELELLVKDKKIEVIPFAFLRGHTFRNCFVLSDECENASYDQLKNLLTRISDGCRIVINGDIAQSDLPRHLQGGLEKIINKLCDGEIEEIGFIKFNRNEIVRDPLISKILDKLEYNIIDPPIKDTWKQYYDPDAEED